MASASYYHPDDNRFSSPFDPSESFTMRPVHHGYVPAQAMQDSPNPDSYVSAHEPLHPAKHSPNLGRLKHRKLEKLKRYGRVIKFLSETISSLFSLAMFVLMVYVIIEYAVTKDKIRGGRSPWPKNAKVWPTIMLLIASAFTLVTSAVILFAYCCCFKRAQGSWKITLAKYAVHTVAWIIISVIYRYERGLHGKNNDLWGWACAEKASPIQDQFNGVINFKSLCTGQVKSLAQIQGVPNAEPRTVELLAFLHCRDRRENRVCHRASGPAEANEQRAEAKFGRRIGRCRCGCRSTGFLRVFSPVTSILYPQFQTFEP